MKLKIKIFLAGVLLILLSIGTTYIWDLGITNEARQFLTMMLGVLSFMGGVGLIILSLDENI